MKRNRLNRTPTLRRSASQRRMLHKKSHQRLLNRRKQFLQLMMDETSRSPA